MELALSSLPVPLDPQVTRFARLVVLSRPTRIDAKPDIVSPRSGSSLDLDALPLSTNLGQEERGGRERCREIERKRRG